METKNYLNDITEIKNMMNRSSRFISLSGLSGILAGIYALVGAAAAHFMLQDFFSSYNRATVGDTTDFIELELHLILVAMTVLVLAVVTGIVLTYSKAKKHNAKMWDVSSKRLLVNFLFPLLTGGAFCLILIQRGIVSLIAPAMLIFYGLACINASKFTFGDIKYLGVINVILGLISSQFIGYGLYFWAFGFGVMHIVYGSIMHFKYDRK
ncbi:hypothetical protein SAMN05216480_11135 [Pustulibacterium marinum]|uniref:Uncharacterized protein n=1 Tax=Pustulibacterium marinum TaxID=1224947 RepID=A0A1I7HUH1_9FLAO|nr:hypothetical protein [Pustulibacterium marinum]SFU64384.1 hypothetical protein SAMN05216480_11135 [Pustulibacterium marinum]